MPRKSAVKIDVIIEKLKEHAEEIRENFNKPSANIWNKISMELNEDMSAAAVYIFVKRNRHDCHHVLQILNSNLIVQPHRFETGDSSNSAEEYCEEFSFFLKYVEWFQINPINLETKKRPTLLPGWTHIFFDKIQASFKTSCIWIFKSNYLSFRGDCFFNGYAYCKECNAKLHIFCEKEPRINEDVEFTCKLYDRNDKLHTQTGKRPLSGIERQKLGKILEDGKLAINWRREEAVKTMEIGSEESRTLYNLTTLRKCKQEFRDKHKYINNCKIQNILVLKYTQPYNSSIHSLSMDPFYIHYWTNDQLQIFNHYCKNTLNATLTIDATGSLVNKLSRPYNNVSGHIFLYCAVIHLGLEYEFAQIPVAQMLSEVHNINYISLWLNEWRCSGALLPKSVVCDFSFALLGSIAKSIARKPDLKQYMEQCFSVLDGSSIDLPCTYIRIDYAHFIKSITQWKSIKNQRKLHKEFYLRIMAKLIKSQTLKEFEHIINSMLIVSSNEYEVEIVKSNNDFLKNVIADFVTIELNEVENQINDSREILDEVASDNILKWIENIKQNVFIANVEEGTPNYYYNPEFSIDFYRIMRTFVLWSGVMISKFNYGRPTASSNIVESYFNDLKNRTLKDYVVPMHVDKFLVTHLDSIKGIVTLASSNCKKNIEQNKDLAMSAVIKRDTIEPDHVAQPLKESEIINKIIVDEQLSDTDIKLDPYTDVCNDKIIENWRGKATEKSHKSKKTSYYGTACTEILHIHETEKTKIGLLKNGFLVNRRFPEKVNDQLVSLANTCPFDSLSQLVASAFCDSKNYCHVLNNVTNNLYIDFIKEFISLGVQKKLYQKRASILMSIYPKQQLINGTIKVSCESNIIYVLERLMHCCYSYNELFVCKCGTKGKKYDVVPIDISKINKEGIIYLQNAISFINCTKYCKKCKHEIECARELGSNIFVETNGCGNIILGDIPVLIKVEEKTFYLRGVVRFQSSADENGIGHYTAYCRRNDAVWEHYDDLQKKMKIVKNSINITIHLILYSI